jgi:hypothetical protein
MSTEVNDPSHWRQRAEEARQLATRLEDAFAKKTLREIAQSYEKLAELAETKKLTD